MSNMKIWKFVPILLIGLCASCKDYLTIDNLETRTVSQDYYDSSQKVEQAVIGGYVDLRRAMFNNYAWLMYAEGRTGDLTVDVDYQTAVVQQKLTADGLKLQQLSDWSYFYDVIHDANDILNIVNNADGNVLTNYQRSLYKGEALALKSMAYFYLARIWGEIPSVEKGNEGTRLSSAQAVELAATWANEAKDLLPWLLLNDDGIESTALTAVRFNKTAIILLLAQEELWLDRGQSAYDLLTQTFTENTADSLSSFGLSIGVDRRTVIPQKPLDAGLVSISLERLNAIYPIGDARRIMFNIPAKGTKVTFVLQAIDVLELLPLKEINLLSAEAAWRSAQLTAAKEFLIKAAVGATENYSGLTQNTFGDALLLERQRLLIGSGQRFFDLIRFGKVGTHVPLLTPQDVQLGAAYWPLSTISMKSNSWNQNSFWARP
jgi:hypothetical protein